VSSPPVSDSLFPVREKRLIAKVFNSGNQIKFPANPSSRILEEHYYRLITKLFARKKIKEYKKNEFFLYL